MHVNTTRQLFTLSTLFLLYLTQAELSFILPVLYPATTQRLPSSRVTIPHNTITSMSHFYRHITH